MCFLFILADALEFLLETCGVVNTEAAAGMMLLAVFFFTFTVLLQRFNVRKWLHMYACLYHVLHS